MKTQTQPKPVTTDALQAGRIYSFVYLAEVEMVNERQLESPAIRRIQDAGGSEPKVNGGTMRHINPLADCAVFVRRVVSAQAAGNETYANVQRKANPDWQPSGDVRWWQVSKDSDCIVEHKTKLTRYLRAIPRGISKEEYFIGAHPATPAQAATIREFKKSAGKDREPAYVLYKTENITNLEDVG